MLASRFTLALASLALSAAIASAADFALGDLTITEPYAYETAATAKAGGGYMTITNAGGTDDRLIEVRSAMPRTEIHTTEVDSDGVARMMHIEAIDIPAGGSVTLAPKQLHVMFMGLPEPLVAGGSLDATLVFENAGEVGITFAIEPRP